MGGRRSGDKRFVAFEWAAGLLWLVLLWAWIKPIAVMSGWTDVDKLGPLLGAVAAAVMIDMLRLSVWSGLPLKGLAALLAVGRLFREAGEHSGWGPDWLMKYASIFSEDLYAFTSGNPGEISGETRTLIFLLGWIILAGVVQSILVYRKRAFWLVSATWLYLLGLQLWPGVDTTGELIASGAAGAALMAWVYLERARTVYATGLIRQSCLEETADDSGSDAQGPEGPGARDSSNANATPGMGLRVTYASRRLAVPAAMPPGRYATVLLMALLLFAGAWFGSLRYGGPMEPLHAGVWSRMAQLFTGASGLGSEDAEAALAALSSGRTSGYGQDDSRLGGPMTVRDEPVFTARSPVATYWRGESKSYYDGRGWTAGSYVESKSEQSSATGTVSGITPNAESSIQFSGESSNIGSSVNFGDGSSNNSSGVKFNDGSSNSSSVKFSAGSSNTGFSNSSLGSVVDTYSIDGKPAVITQEVMYHPSFDPGVLLTGGVIDKVDALYSREGREWPVQAVEHDELAGRYSFTSGYRSLGYARLQVRTDGLQPYELLSADGAVPEDISRFYLQLPDKLPQRVRRLAADISAEGSSPYAKALLIERYLRQNYRYSLTDAAIPKAGHDFVDTFLFAGSGGYCDYFSTSMAVMLRSVGIPARWVKGFAPGVTVSEEDGIKTIAVSSKNAHSWVEAYIPGAGWVPLDPTPGFGGFAGPAASQLQAFLQTQKQEDGSGRQSAGWRPFGWSAPDWEAGRRVGQGAEALARAAGRLAAAHTAALVVGMAALGLAAWVIHSRGRFLALLLLLRLRPRGRRGAALTLRLLDQLWSGVFRRYGEPAAGQTMREYAACTGAQLPQLMQPLRELASLYEEARFAPGNKTWVPSGQLLGLWQALLPGRSWRQRPPIDPHSYTP